MTVKKKLIMICKEVILKIKEGIKTIILQVTVEV